MGRNHEAAQGREGFNGWKQDGEGLLRRMQLSAAVCPGDYVADRVCGLLRAALGQREGRHTPDATARGERGRLAAFDNYCHFLYSRIKSVIEKSNISRGVCHEHEY